MYTRLLAAIPSSPTGGAASSTPLTGELIDLPAGCGADPETAALAAGLGIGCFLTAYRLAGDDAATLLPALRRAFERLHALP